MRGFVRNPFPGITYLLVTLGVSHCLIQVQPPATILTLDNVGCAPVRPTGNTSTASTTTGKKLQDYCDGRIFNVTLRGTPFGDYSPLSTTGMPSAFQAFTNLTNFYRLKIIVEDFVSKTPTNKEIVDNSLSGLGAKLVNDSGTRIVVVTIPETDLPTTLNCSLALVHVVLYQDKALVSGLTSNELLHPHFPIKGVREVSSTSIQTTGSQCAPNGGPKQTDLALTVQNKNDTSLDWWVSSIFQSFVDGSSGGDQPWFTSDGSSGAMRKKRSPAGAHQGTVQSSVNPKSSGSSLGGAGNCSSGYDLGTFIHGHGYWPSSFSGSQISWDCIWSPLFLGRSGGGRPEGGWGDGFTGSPPTGS